MANLSNMVISPKVLVGDNTNKGGGFIAIENGSLETVGVLDKYPDLKSLSIEELKNAVEYLKRKERYTSPNNGVKFIIVKKLEAERLLEQLEANSNY